MYKWMCRSQYVWQSSYHFWCQVNTLLECALLCVMFISSTYIYTWRLVRRGIKKNKVWEKILVCVLCTVIHKLECYDRTSGLYAVSSLWAFGGGVLFLISALCSRSSLVPIPLVSPHCTQSNKVSAAQYNLDAGSWFKPLAYCVTLSKISNPSLLQRWFLIADPTFVEDAIKKRM